MPDDKNNTPESTPSALNAQKINEVIEREQVQCSRGFNATAKPIEELTRKRRDVEVANSAKRSGRYVDPSVPRIRNEVRRRGSDFSYAYCIFPFYLYSDGAQRFFERGYQWVDRSLLSISLISTIVGDPELTKKLTREAEAICRDLQLKISDGIEKLRTRMNENNIPAELQIPAYDHKRIYRPAVHTPQAMQFIALAQLLDRIIARIEGGWINGYYDVDQRNRLINAWVEACRVFPPELQKILEEARKEATSAGKRTEAATIEQNVSADESNERLAESAQVVHEGEGTELRDLETPTTNLKPTPKPATATPVAEPAPAVVNDSANDVEQNAQQTTPDD